MRLLSNLVMIHFTPCRRRCREAGDVALTARESLNAAVSGTGDILYFVRPEEIHTEISGVGDLEPGE